MHFERRNFFKRHYFVLALMAQTQCRKATQAINQFQIFNKFPCVEAIAIRLIISAALYIATHF